MKIFCAVIRCNRNIEKKFFSKSDELIFKLLIFLYIYLFLVSLNKDRSLNLCRNVNFFHKKSGKIKFNGKLGTCSLKMLKWKSELTLKICCMVVIKLLLQFMSISWIFLLMFCNLPVLHSGIDCVKDLHPENGSWQVVAWKR